MNLSRFVKVARTQVSIIALLGTIWFAQLANAQELGILAVGDGVVTGFSGVVEPIAQEPPLTSAQILDETLINRDGISARINYLAAPSFIWDARAWPSNNTLEFFARDIGQVFGVTIDDAEKPNIYLSATSAYGLQIVSPDADNDGRPEREKAGGKDAVWMEGQWGKADTKGEDGSTGGPGSIWKVDGVNGEISLFANVQLDGIDNAGAGLGNIVYVASLKQIFVSDLSTGMIHRYAMDGTEVDIFDHGVTGRTSAELKPVKYDADARLDITSSDFDPQDTDTWGLSDEDRRVYGLAFNNGRLYYAVRGGSQIWSVGFDKDTGKFLESAQWEIDVPEKPKSLPITDMLFTHKGALVLAQRGEVTSTYDYAGLGEHGKARVYRYWLESPKDDPDTPSRWIAEPEEYAVGFEKNNRQTSGGLALNHGYTADGYLDTTICEASLWTTGDDLRQSEVAELVAALNPGGPQEIDGLQGMPAGVELLPQLPRSGNLHSIAWMATNDATFRADLTALVNNAGTMGAADLREAFEALLLDWAGADNVPEGSRGAWVDEGWGSAIACNDNVCRVMKAA